MSKFEKKFGKYAIHNLTMVLIMCYVYAGLQPAGARSDQRAWLRRRSGSGEEAGLTGPIHCSDASGLPSGSPFFMSSLAGVLPVFVVLPADAGQGALSLANHRDADGVAQDGNVPR